ncbi:unnamed protein product, partial [Brenthis ino]
MKKNTVGSISTCLPNKLIDSNRNVEWQARTALSQAVGISGAPAPSALLLMFRPMQYTVYSGPTTGYGVMYDRFFLNHARKTNTQPYTNVAPAPFREAVVESIPLHSRQVR